MNQTTGSGHLSVDAACCVRQRAIGYVVGAVRRSTGHGTRTTAVYILHTAPLFDIIAQHRVNAHQYADDLQLYICEPPAEATIATDRLDECLVDVEAWLKARRLRLNPSKSQLMWLGSAQQLAKVRLDGVPVLSSQLGVVDTARNLGVVVDSQLSMSTHFAVVCRGGCNQLAAATQEVHDGRSH